MAPWLRYLIAFLVACHGFIFIGPGSPARTYTGWTGVSWVLGNAVTGDRLKALAMGLHAIAGVATLICAAAIAFAPSIPGWWRPLAITAGVAGIAAFAAFWDGQKQFLFQEGVVGAVVSLLLLVSAIAFAGALS